MEYATLGKTGLRVSVMGLGCGGHSRLGMSQGKSDTEASLIVREALDMGINFIDTAESYGTESAVGLGLQGVVRDRVVISTKAGVGWQDRRCTADEFKQRVDSCLQRLQTDYVDVFHVHGVRIEEYEYACEELVPALMDLRTAGKIRFVGITEAFGPDPTHKMLVRAVQDDCWDVMMVGLNILNQSARERVLAVTQKKQIGTLCMFAVRRALSRPDALRELIAQMVTDGLIKDVDPDDPLGFLVADGVADSVQDAAYRFCRWEPGIDLVLSGTGNVDHLKANAESLARPALPPEIVERLKSMFAGVDSVSGN